MWSVRRRLRHPSTIHLMCSGRLSRPPFFVRSKPNLVAIFTSFRERLKRTANDDLTCVGSIYFGCVEECHAVPVRLTDDLDGIVDGRCRTIVGGQVHATKSEFRYFEFSQLSCFHVFSRNREAFFDSSSDIKPLEHGISPRRNTWPVK